MSRDTIRISVFTGKYDSPDRKKSVVEASEKSKAHGADILVLPGYSLGKEESPRTLRLNRNLLQALADKTGVSILGETGDTYLFRPNQSRLGPFHQEFATSKNAKRDAIQKVIDGFQTGSRIIQVRNTRIGVLLCGENNIVRNVQAADYVPFPRHEGLSLPEVYDILLNPAHSSMGEFHLLHQRFAYWSRDNRTVIHCTNNTHTKSWHTSICIYHNSQELVMGDFSGETEWPTAIGKNWRLVTVQV